MGGFDELMDEDKKWEVLDSRIASDHPTFVPPSAKCVDGSTSSESITELKKTFEDLMKVLKKTTSDLEEKIALAYTEKYLAMERATQSEMKVLALEQKHQDLSIKVTKMEVDHDLKVVRLKDRAYHVEEEAAVALKEAAKAEKKIVDLKEKVEALEAERVTLRE